MDLTYEDILKEMNDEFELQAGYASDDASDIGIRLKVLAGEIYNSMVNAEWIKRQMFPQTADGVQLEYHAQQRGLERKSAVKATGELTFSIPAVLGYDIVIPLNTVCATSQSDNVRYQTTEEATLAAGDSSVTVQAEAVDGGAKGNCLEDCITVIISSVTGISTVTNESAFAGGLDEETDEELRERLISSYKNISNGTNKAFYKEEALKIDGVTSVGVVAQDRGVGTVDIYIWSDGTPSSSLINTVEAQFNKIREINVDVEVYAPDEIECAISIKILCKEGYSFSTVSAVCEEVIQDYVDGLGIGENFYVAEMGKRIMQVDGVENYFLRGTTADKTVEQNEKAVVDYISITEGVS